MRILDILTEEQLKKISEYQKKYRAERYQYTRPEPVTLTLGLTYVSRETLKQGAKGG